MKNLHFYEKYVKIINRVIMFTNTREEEIMEDKVLDISQEELEKLSFEELADLKVEVDELILKLDSIMETCDEALQS